MFKIDDEKLQHAHDALHHVKPWRDQDDMINSLEYLCAFHKSLCDDYYNPDRVLKFAKKICDFINAALDKDNGLRHKIAEYENLNEAERKNVILKLFNVLSEFSPEVKHIGIGFLNKQTKTTARAYHDQNRIEFYNVGSNPQMSNYKDLIFIVTHEFTHLLQNIGASTIPGYIVEQAAKHSCSSAGFSDCGDEVKKLAGSVWRNNILEKEAIVVGDYCIENIEV